LVKGVDMENGRRTPDILSQENFWINKKLIDLFDSHYKMDVAATDFSNETATMELIAKIKNPHYQEDMPPTPSA